MTYINLNTTNRSDPHSWVLQGRVSIEFLRALVPLDGVDTVVIQVVKAGHRDVATSLGDSRYDVQFRGTEAARTCERRRKDVENLYIYERWFI